jgi:HAD superfamily hydrolase (TIGR01549 family)
MDNIRKDRIAEDIVSHYTESYDESIRLTNGFGRLERARTEELIARFLPKAPAVVIDIGGASGIYSFFMAGLGYQVHLVDLVPKHIEQAQLKSREQASPKLASMRVGDARVLDFCDESTDAVLMHGPLYHLTAMEERKAVLSEAWRILRPGGVLLAFAITRHAGALYGITKGYIYDYEYRQAIRTEVESGRRVMRSKQMKTLPDAYFHLPDELREELQTSHFACDKVLGIIGPAWMVPDIDTAWNEPAKRESILEMARLLENEPVLGPRLIAVASKPSRYILWDFGGTLAYREGMWAGALHDAILRHLPQMELSLDAVRPWLMYRPEFFWNSPAVEHRHLTTAEAWWDELNPVFTRALTGLGIDSDKSQSIIESVRSEFLRQDAWHVIEGAEDTLKTLSQSGWKHVIVSNHVPELPGLVAALGLSPYFERIFCSAQMGVEKPNPGFLEFVLSSLGCSCETWMIGDSVRMDIAAARAAHLASILIGSVDPLADRCVSSMGEVTEIILRDPLPLSEMSDPCGQRL